MTSALPAGPGAIDMHTHIFPDELAARAMAALSAECPDFPPFADGTRAGLLAAMDAAGVERAVTAAIATKPSQAAAIFRFSEALRGDRLIPFPSVHPADDEAIDWIGRIAESGFRGVKLHPQYQGLDLDDPRVVAVLSAARDAGLVVLMHAGQDPAYPGDMRARPANMARLLDAAPGGRVVCAHFGGWKDWPEVLDCLAGREGLWLDTSCSLNWLPADLACAIIERHGSGRVVFGSDSPWRDLSAELARVQALGLNETALRGILRGNALALMGLPDA